jgi:hypothetical protein
MSARTHIRGHGPRRLAHAWPVAAVVLALVVASGFVPARPVAACNACLEDKIAATYDWQVAAAAQRHGHTVVFLALAGPVAPGDDALIRRITHGIAGTPGVDAGTVRVSLAPAAVSFASDLRRRPVSELLSAMNERLRPAGLKVTVVRIGAPGAPATTASFTH